MLCVSVSAWQFTVVEVDMHSAQTTGKILLSDIGGLFQGKGVHLCLVSHISDIIWLWKS
jgi:hypothetical protein